MTQATVVTHLSYHRPLFLTILPTVVSRRIVRSLLYKKTGKVRVCRFCASCAISPANLREIGGRKETRTVKTLQWRHNGRDSVSNHQPHHCLLNGLFRRRSKKTSKLRVTGLCAGNSPVTGELPAQMASNAENVSIWWRHHELLETIGRVGAILTSSFARLLQWLGTIPVKF